MLRQEDIDSVKNNVNMPMVAAYYGIQVNKKGFALCPFHQDKRPSMRIYKGYADNDGFHCFSCGKCGSIIKFIMEFENLSYEEAVTHLAKIFNVRISNMDTGKPDPEERYRISQEKYCMKISILLKQNNIKEVHDLAEQINLIEDILKYCIPYGKTFCMLEDSLPKLKAEWDEKYACTFRKDKEIKKSDFITIKQQYELSETIKEGNRNIIYFLKALLSKEREECQKRRKLT